MSTATLDLRAIERERPADPRGRLSSWLAGLPEQVSAIPAQRHRMKLVAFVALWALALAVVVPLVLQGAFSAVELELDLRTPEGTVNAPAPAIGDALDGS